MKCSNEYFLINYSIFISTFLFEFVLSERKENRTLKNCIQMKQCFNNCLDFPVISCMRYIEFP